MPLHTISDRAVIASGARDAFPGASDIDIMRFVELVMGATVSAAEAELRAILLGAKALNQPKKSMRDPDEKKPLSTQQQLKLRQLVDPTARARATIANLLARLGGAGDPPPGNIR